MCRPRENNGVGLRRQPRHLIWFSWMKEVLYLPPYSPDLNPIEKLWSKVKAIWRKLRVRSPDALDDAIHFALNCVSAADCVGYCLF